MRPLNKRKLTPLDATRLRPRTRVFLVWDSLERGLALRVQPTGHKSYQFVYHFRGRSRWFHIGPADAVSLALARETATRLRLEVHQGKDPAATLRTSAAATGTFAVIAGRYVEEYSKKKNKSWEQADWLITRYVLPHWAGRDASTLSRADVRAMLAKIDRPVLQNQVLASASAIFTWAGKQEILTNNPCRGIERHETASRERVLSDAEVPLFWNAFSNASFGGRVGVMAGEALKVLLLTGQRPGEVSHMRHEHIEGEWWTMPGAPEPATRWPGTKNAQTHRVFLPAKVRDIIADLGTDNTGFVFGEIPALDAAMRDICKTLSVPRCTPHDLRRTHGTCVTGLGFGRPAMNRIQNHTEGGISSVYDRYEYAEENKRIMESVAARLIALAEGTDAPTNVVSLRS
jgi:integrase